MGARAPLQALAAGFVLLDAFSWVWECLEAVGAMRGLGSVELLGVRCAVRSGRWGCCSGARRCDGGCTVGVCGGVSGLGAGGEPESGIEFQPLVGCSGSVAIICVGGGGRGGSSAKCDFGSALEWVELAAGCEPESGAARERAERRGGCVGRRRVGGGRTGPASDAGGALERDAVASGFESEPVSRGLTRRCGCGGSQQRVGGRPIQHLPSPFADPDRALERSAMAPGAQSESGPTVERACECRCGFRQRCVGGRDARPSPNTDRALERISVERRLQPQRLRQAQAQPPGRRRCSLIIRGAGRRLHHLPARRFRPAVRDAPQRCRLEHRIHRTPTRIPHARHLSPRRGHDLGRRRSRRRLRLQRHRRAPTQRALERLPVEPRQRADPCSCVAIQHRPNPNHISILGSRPEPREHGNDSHRATLLIMKPSLSPLGG
jgi:hypothetical protein